jgi:hypothetical protein
MALRHANDLREKEEAASKQHQREQEEAAWLPHRQYANIAVSTRTLRGCLICEGQLNKELIPPMALRHANDLREKEEAASTQRKREQEEAASKQRKKEQVEAAASNQREIQLLREKVRSSSS